MKGYSAKVIYSSKELTKREQLRIEDLPDAIALDNIISDGEHFILQPDYYVKLSIHNEYSRDSQEYEKYVIVDKGGALYTTGSQSFIDSFEHIAEVMGNEPYDVDVFKMPSKNYTGKSFITCTIA